MSNIHDKVQAILDRANHPNTPKEEAETALAMAHRLILKHGLDEHAFGNGKVDDTAIVRDSIAFPGTWAVRRMSLAYVIALANSVAAYRTNTYVDGKRVKAIVLFGTKADIFAAKTLYASAEMLAVRTMPKGDRSYRNSWWLGFTNGISNVLAKAKREAVKEYGEGAGLVLANKFDRANKEMRSKVTLRSASTSSYSRSSEGYYAGRAAGGSFSTGGHRIGGSAIGALSR